MRGWQLIAGMTGIALLGFGAIFLLTRERTAAPVSLQGQAPRVVATFYPLAALAQGVLGDQGMVETIVPGGVEPHDYEPTSKDIIAVRSADIFLFNGAGIDPWAEELRSDLESAGVRVVSMTEHADLLVNGDDGGHNSYDPHFWLDPIAAKAFVTAVRLAVSAEDPAHAGEYEGNAERVDKKLSGIDASFREMLSSCGKRRVVVSHDAFRYLAKRYGFETLSIAGISPESEPSARRMAELVALVKKEDIRYIFLETLASPKVAETLAHEAGVGTLTFNPIEGLTDDDVASGKDYFSIMKENLENLAKAMECR